MQPSFHTRESPRLALLATLLALLAILTVNALLERKQKGSDLSMKRSEQHPEPVEVTPPPVHRSSSSTGQRLPFREKRSMVLGAGATLLVLALILLIVAAATLLPGLHLTSSQAKFSQVSRSSTAAPATTARTTFEKGIVFPRWFPGAYGPADTVWQSGMRSIKPQTGAQWIEMPVLFSQAGPQSVVVEHSQSTPSVDAFSDGVRTAHALGFHVFFVPLMSVRVPGDWSGSIDLLTGQMQQAWFDSYWATLQPYVQAAAKDNVEQMAICTELQRLQQSVAAPKWNQLIARIRTVFKNTLTYDMNWSSLSQPLPDWLRNPDLAMIGVSSYIPLSDVAQHIDPQNMPALWQTKVRERLDVLAQQVGKPVLISEIGYRNTSDALYRTWESHSNAPLDAQEQAGAFNAALSNVYADRQIAGIFFWGWDDVDQFTIKNRLAAGVLLKWYSQSAA